MILTTEEFRSLSSTALEDDALALVLDAAEQEIVRAAGPAGSATEILRGHRGTDIILGRQAESITSVTETWGTTDTVLSADDYLLHSDGYVLERLRTGTNPRWAWHWSRVTVVYVPADDDALRAGVQRDLVNLMLDYTPGVTQETVGAWTRILGSNSAWNQNEERNAILARLSDGPSLVVV